LSVKTPLTFNKRYLQYTVKALHKYKCTQSIVYHSSFHYENKLGVGTEIHNINSVTYFWWHMRF